MRAPLVYLTRLFGKSGLRGGEGAPTAKVTEMRGKRDIVACTSDVEKITT